MTNPFIKVIVEHMKFLCEHELYEWHNRPASNILVDDENEWYITDIGQSILLKVINPNIIPDAFSDGTDVRNIKIHGLNGSYAHLNYSGTIRRDGGDVDVYLTENDETVYLSPKLLKRYFSSAELRDLCFYYNEEAKNPGASFVCIGDINGNLIGYVLPVRL